MARSAPCSRCHRPRHVTPKSRPDMVCQSCRAELRTERAQMCADLRLLRIAGPVRRLVVRMPETRTCQACGCAYLAKRSNQKFCATCRARRGRVTRSTVERGYGADHRRLRREWQQRLNDGEHVECHARVCFMRTRTISPDDPWDLGHLQDRTGWTGPEHRYCNRKEPQLRATPRPRRRWTL